MVFINDFPSVSNLLKPTLFADDTTFTYSEYDYENIVRTLNTELVTIDTWTRSNKLLINADKTELILISNRLSSPQSSNIKLNGQELKFTDKCKFLGVMLDNRLTFADHINYVTSKISKNIGIFYKIRQNLNLEARLNFYNSLILPYLSYNIVIWGGVAASHLCSLVRQQKRMVRLILDESRYSHSPPIFANLRLLKLEDLYKFNVALLMFENNLNGLYAVPHNYPTRNRNLARPEFQRLSISQQNLQFAGPRIWNQLPQNIRDIKYLGRFKIQLKNYYIEQYGST